MIFLSPACQQPKMTRKESHCSHQVIFE